MHLREKRRIINVDFSVLCTDAWTLKCEMFGEKQIRNLLDKCRDTGFDAVAWRTRFAGKAVYRGKTIAPFDGCYDMRLIGMREVMKNIDPLAVAISHAHDIGLKIFSWVDPFDCYIIGADDDFFRINCQYLIRAKNGAILRTPCYNYPEVRTRYVDEALEYMQYGVDGISYSLFNTHLWGSRVPHDMEGQYIYGYNEPIVAAYKNKFNIDILKETPDPVRLAHIQGDGVTELLREIHAAVNAANVEILVTTRMDDHLGGGIYPHAWIYNDWRTWTHQGIVDTIAFDHCMNPMQTLKNIVNEKASMMNKSCRLGIWFCAWHDYATDEYSRVFQNEFLATQEITDIIIHEAGSFVFGKTSSVPQHPASNTTLWDVWHSCHMPNKSCVQE